MNEQDRKIAEKLRRCDECEDVEDCGYGNSYCGDKTIRDYCKIAANLIEKQSAEIEQLKNRIADMSKAIQYNGRKGWDKIKELVDENEFLKNRVYNLTLYLKENDVVMWFNKEPATNFRFDLLRQIEHDHPSVPGYHPEILEVQHE